MAKYVVNSRLPFARNFILAERFRLRSSPLLQAATRCAKLKKTKLMKSRLTIILIILISNLYSQSVVDINRTLKIPDSLDQDVEIRIYKWFSTTTESQVFRIFREGDIYCAEFYKHYKSLDQSTKSKFEQIKITSKRDLNVIFLELILTNIEYLPNLNEIKYKLVESKIVFEDGEYLISKLIGFPIDGIAYKCFVKNGPKRNNFEFNNYDSYLEKFPEVDEINSYSKIIEIIKSEFGILQ